MGSYYSRRKSRKHLTTVAFIILLLLFLFLYAKASSSSSPDGIHHHHSIHGSFKKPGAFDPKLHDRSFNDASRESRYTYEGGEHVFENNKRRVFTGPNPLHNK
ncbi:CLAVATA3/ESR (CLE)-related protein 22 [Raphanus sativus]|uniref:CLAVATA3/ESR (CLE)-related protein 22-like n=1 Tax=Raphanus sativus TaxID=3726 RepID=A0A6J0KHW0_RAPSA|nr:CLAVATA3/ESR (CLE)-related protein 22-like [Raphanus sativus]KAJ4882968.1 CLAVATA3/ESR (CLE)-related protein 22 [Raphanus sativus]